MFGATGVEEVLAFKRQWLTQEINYNVDAILAIDEGNRVVVASFDSLIAGKEPAETMPSVHLYVICNLRTYFESSANNVTWYVMYDTKGGLTKYA